MVLAPRASIPSSLGGHFRAIRYEPCRRRPGGGLLHHTDLLACQQAFSRMASEKRAKRNGAAPAAQKTDLGPSARRLVVPGAPRYLVQRGPADLAMLVAVARSSVSDACSKLSRELSASGRTRRISSSLRWVAA